MCELNICTYLISGIMLNFKLLTSRKNKMWGVKFVFLLLFTCGSSMLDGNNLPTISELTGIIQHLNKTVDGLTKKNQDLETKMASLITDNHALQREMLVILTNQNKSLHPAYTVAFSASLRSTIDSLGDHQTIEFSNVMTNLGNAYDPRHGHFVAPVKGVYQFSVTMFGWSGQQNSYEMVKNGNLVCRAYSAVGSNDKSQGACTGVVVLEINDMVWIRFAWGGRHLYGADYSIFSGFLIKRL